jgi:hypothetical protein
LAYKNGEHKKTQFLPAYKADNSKIIWGAASIGAIKIKENQLDAIRISVGNHKKRRNIWIVKKAWIVAPNWWLIEKWRLAKYWIGNRDWLLRL